MVEFQPSPAESTSDLSNLFVNSRMENKDSPLKSSRSRREGKDSQREKASNAEDHAITVEMLRKLQQMEDQTANNNNTLVAVDTSLRKSASFQNITELSEDCSIDLRRRGSDPRSAPRSPVGTKRTPDRRPQKPWELRRSSTPIPGALEVSSVLRKALGRFSPEVGHSSVKEKEEFDD